MVRHIGYAGTIAVLILSCVAIGADVAPSTPPQGASPAAAPAAMQDIMLPPARTSGSASVEAALAARGRVTGLDKKAVSLEQISQLGAAVYGTGQLEQAAVSPVGMYFVLETGVYVYKPVTNSLGKVTKGDKRQFLAGVVSAIRAVSDAPCTVVLTVKTARLGESTLLAVGRASEAVDIQALAMGLASVTCEKIGAGEAAEALGLPAEDAPVCVMAVGYPVGGPLVTVTATKPQDTIVTQADHVLLVVPSKGIIEAEYDGVMKSLTSAGYAVTVAGAEEGTYKTTAGKDVTVTVKAGAADPGMYEGLIILGGVEARQYYQDSGVRKIVTEMSEAKKPIGAISTGPRILANAGLLTGLRTTGSRSERDALTKAGAVVSGVDVERDISKDGGVIVTSMGGKLVVAKFTQEMINAMKQSRGEQKQTPKATEATKGGTTTASPRQPAAPTTPPGPAKKTY